MNKRLITIALSLMSVFCMTSASAQFNLGAGFAFNKYGGDYGKMHPAIQPHIGYLVPRMKIFVDAGFNFSPVATNESYGFVAYDQNGAAMDAEISQKLTIHNAFLHLGKMFGDLDNNFNFKIFAGASVDYLSFKYSAKVPNGYETGDLQDQKFQGYKVDFGIGGEVKLGESGKLFIDLYGALPATHVNEVAIENPTVNHIGLAIGYKIYIGSSAGGGSGPFNVPGYNSFNRGRQFKYRNAARPRRPLR